MVGFPPGLFPLKTWQVEPNYGIRHIVRQSSTDARSFRQKLNNIPGAEMTGIMHVGYVDFMFAWDIAYTKLSYKTGVAMQGRLLDEFGSPHRYDPEFFRLAEWVIPYVNRLKSFMGVFHDATLGDACALAQLSDNAIDLGPGQQLYIRQKHKETELVRLSPNKAHDTVTLEHMICLESSLRHRLEFWRRCLSDDPWSPSKLYIGDQLSTPDGSTASTKKDRSVHL